MTNTNFRLTGRFRSAVVVVALVLASLTASAQSGGTIETGVTIPVRTNEEIKADRADGRIHTGTVDQDVRDTRGNVAIPRGTYVELVVRSTSNNEYVLDLESVTLDGRRLAVQAENTNVQGEREEGVGANSRTGRYVGGGAAIGAIIGAITGGSKGAAIGGAVGAAGGAGTQILTRGKSVRVPSESLVTFRLEQRLRTGVADPGFSRNGNHYHQGYGTEAGNTSAYDAGLKAGRADRQANRTFNARSNAWIGPELTDYQDGYERGFDESVPRPARAGQTSPAEIRIGGDRYVTWKAPAASQVYVQVDDGPRRLFSREASGNEPAPWISYGHKYAFIVTDPNGREIARDENDLRQRRVR